MQNKPIILQLVPRFNSGGVERVTIDIAGFLAQYDDLPTYVGSAGGILVPELEGRGVIHIQLPIATKNPFKMIWNGIRIAFLVKRLGIQIIHARSRAPAWSAFIASKLSGVPYITTYHGAYRVNAPLKNWYNSVMVRGKCVISISNFISDVIQGHHGKLKPNVIRIYPGVDANGLLNPELYSVEDVKQQRDLWGIPQDAFVMLAIGRIARAKRYDLVVKALGKLVKEGYQNLYLVIAGSDQGRVELSQNLRDLAQELGVTDRLIMVPDFKDIPLVYAISDLVIFPSEMRETYGRITAEAGAMGKIIIASNVGAVAELICEGQTGYTFASGSIEQLLDRIRSVLALSARERIAMGQQARKHIVDNFSADRMYAETLEVYRKIIS